VIVRVELPELEPTDTEEGEILQVANGAGPVSIVGKDNPAIMLLIEIIL